MKHLLYSNKSIAFSLLYLITYSTPSYSTPGFDECPAIYKNSAYLANRIYSHDDKLIRIESKLFYPSFLESIVVGEQPKVYVDLIHQYKRFCKLDEVNNKVFGLQARAYRDIKTGDIYISFRGTEIGCGFKLEHTMFFLPQIRFNDNCFETYKDLLRSDIGIGFEELLNIESKWWGSALEIAAQFTDKVVKNKKSYIQCDTPHESDKIILTGHSLGGAIVQVEGARTGYTSYTFNAPGVCASIKRRKLTFTNEQNVYNFVRAGTRESIIDGDVVKSIAGHHYGNIIEHPNRGSDFKIVQDSKSISPEIINGPSAHNMTDYMIDAIECSFVDTKSTNSKIVFTNSQLSTCTGTHPPSPPHLYK